MAILEVLRGGLGPDFKLLMVRFQFCQKLGSIVDRCIVVVRRQGQSAIKMVLGLVDHADNRPENWLCSSSCCYGRLVIAGHDTSLELQDVITADDSHVSIALHEPFIFILVELGAAKGREIYSEPSHGLYETPCPNDDLTGRVK